MAIDRGPWNALVDDDGSNLIGSIWNKTAIKTVLLDPIDGLVGSPTAWTPIDRSGAGLILTNSSTYYIRIGKLVAVSCLFSYPTTSNGAAAVVGGLPAPSVGPSGLYVTYGIQNVAHISVGTDYIQMFHPTNGSARSNAELSGALIALAGIYLST
jgi:hypothetical protein